MSNKKMKSWTGPFKQMWNSGRDNVFEPRQANEHFVQGNKITFEEFDPIYNQYTGRVIETEIEQVQPEGFLNFPPELRVLKLQVKKKITKPIKIK